MMKKIKNLQAMIAKAENFLLSEQLQVNLSEMKLKNGLNKYSFLLPVIGAPLLIFFLKSSRSRKTLKTLYRISGKVFLAKRLLKYFDRKA